MVVMEVVHVLRLLWHGVGGGSVGEAPNVAGSIAHVDVTGNSMEMVGVVEVFSRPVSWPLDSWWLVCPWCAWCACSPWGMKK
jgi:hypothetical protein